MVDVVGADIRYGVTIAIAIDSTLWVALPTCGVMIFCILLMVGCWYEIDGNQLVVYQFFRPHRFPIDKISEVKKTTGILATAGMSVRRVSIKFADRSVMKRLHAIRDFAQRSR